MDLTAKTGQMLVHRVVNNLIDKMVQALAGDTADVHAGTLADGLENLPARKYCRHYKNWLVP